MKTCCRQAGRDRTEVPHDTVKALIANNLMLILTKLPYKKNHAYRRRSPRTDAPLSIRCEINAVHGGSRVSASACHVTFPLEAHNAANTAVGNNDIPVCTCFTNEFSSLLGAFPNAMSDFSAL